MGRYFEWAPFASARGVLECTWRRDTPLGTSEVTRVVPDGCVDLIWTGTRLFVAGPDTGPHLATSRPGTLVGVRLAPGAAPALLGLPASELVDGRPDLADITPRLARLAEGLTEVLVEATDPDLAAELMQDAVLAGSRANELDPALPAILAALRAGIGVRELATRLGITERGLHRRCRTAFGYGPKVLQRVLRFRRAVQLARGGGSFADTSAVAGYADQAHLAREVRALAGVSLGELLRADRRRAG